MPESETLRLETTNSVAYLTFNRPEVLNAMNHELRTGLTAQLKELNDDDSVRVVVLQGAGRAFCAGQDQKESRQFTAEGAARRIETYVALFQALRDMNKPILAGIRGYAVGAGLQIAALADIRVATPEAKFALPELKIGAPAITGSGILWPIIGEANVRRLVLTSDFIDSAEALRLGLVHEIVSEDELGARVKALSEQLADKPPLAVRLCKEWWREMTATSFAQTAAHAVGAHASSYASGELRAGAAKFLARKGEGSSVGSA